MDIPVLVKKNGEGPVIFLQSSLHGDELAGAQVIFELFKDLANREVTGTVVGIVGANPTGIPLHSRYFYKTTSGGSQTDLNRQMPGSATSSDSGIRLAYSLWNDLYMPSEPTFFFDLHTTATGASFPYFIYSDRRNELIDQLMSATPADIIKDDPGQDGTVETEMMKAGVPAVTLELGSAKEWNKDINMRGVQGIKNCMHLMEMLDLGEDGVDMMGVESFKCNTFSSIRATRGGYMETTVELEDDVEEGDVVGYLYDAFGDIRETYTAPLAGRVTSMATDPIREPGSTIVRLCYQEEPEKEDEEDEVAVNTKKALLRGVATGKAKHFEG